MIPLAKWAFLLVLPALAESANSTPKIPETLQNADFTQGALGDFPKGWVMSPQAKETGFFCEIKEDPSLPGKRCACIHRNDNEGTTLGQLSQTIDAKPYRGKRVRLETQLRAEPGQGQMWFLVRRAGGKRAFMDKTEDRPVSSQKWTHVEIIADVAMDAESLEIGPALKGGLCRLFVAPIQIKILGDTPSSSIEGPRILSEQGLKNLTAFTKAMNYIRFFYPSDAAAQANWHRIAIDGVKTMEGAATEADLVQRLQTFFAPLAPNAQFLLAGQKPTIPSIPSQAAFRVRWEHNGFSQGDMSFFPYSSSRNFLLMAYDNGEAWADPLSSITLKIGDAIHLWLPTVIFADAAKNTLPLVNKTQNEDALPEPTAGGSGDDRGTRLSAVAFSWGIFQHFYPYFDVVKVDWNAELSKAFQAAATDKDAEAFTHTLARMVATLRDGHGGVVPPLTCSKNHAWPPIAVTFLNGQPYVNFRSKNANDIPLGSRILSVDGEDAELRKLRFCQEIPATTESYLRAQLASVFLAGEVLSNAKIVFQTPEGEKKEALLSRNCSFSAKDSHLPNKMIELKPNIWYVDLYQITDDEFTAALPKLVRAKGIIFDVSIYLTCFNFLSHLTDKRMEYLPIYLPKIIQPDGQAWEWEHRPGFIEPATPKLQAKIMFLAAGIAGSAAETALAMVKAHKLGTIVGENTAGVDGVANAFTCPGDYCLRFTGEKVTQYDGSQFHCLGVKPDVLVEPTLKGIMQDRHEALEKALELITNS